METDEGVVAGGETLHVADHGVVALVSTPTHPRLRGAGTFELWPPGSLHVLHLDGSLEVEDGGGELEAAAGEKSSEERLLLGTDQEVHSGDWQAGGSPGPGDSSPARYALLYRGTVKNINYFKGIPPFFGPNGLLWSLFSQPDSFLFLLTLNEA